MNILGESEISYLGTYTLNVSMLLLDSECAANYMRVGLYSDFLTLALPDSHTQSCIAV